jgi:hypothetical protein
MKYVEHTTQFVNTIDLGDEVLGKLWGLGFLVRYEFVIVLDVVFNRLGLLDQFRTDPNGC